MVTEISWKGFRAREQLPVIAHGLSWWCPICTYSHVPPFTYKVKDAEVHFYMRERLGALKLSFHSSLPHTVQRSFLPWNNVGYRKQVQLDKTALETAKPSRIKQVKGRGLRSHHSFNPFHVKKEPCIYIPYTKRQTHKYVYMYAQVTFIWAQRKSYPRTPFGWKTSNLRGKNRFFKDL